MSNYFKLGVLFMTVSIIITIASTFYEPESIVERISVKISNIIQILFLVGLLISYQSYNNATKQNLLDHQASLTEKAWVEVYDKIRTSYDKCPNFCKSLGFSWQIPSDVDVNPEKVVIGKDDYGTVLSISISIFQSFSSVFNYFLYYESEEVLNQWLSSFILWCNSETLYTIWNQNKFVYDILIQNCVDEIFNEVRSYNSGSRPKTGDDITELAGKICKSDSIRNAFSSVGKINPCN